MTFYCQNGKMGKNVDKVCNSPYANFLLLENLDGNIKSILFDIIDIYLGDTNARKADVH
ncbi:MAG TPA: hypothetical protein VIM16_22705 [Mucilaginibacter sp.]